MRKFDQQNSGRFITDSGYDFGPLSRGLSAMERNAPESYFLPPEPSGPVISGGETVNSFAIEPIDPTPQAFPSAGSIAFTGWNADDPDSLAFVVLEDIAAGSVITFDDNEWNGTAFNTGEGTLTLTLTTGATAGTVIRIDGSNTATPTTSLGTIVRNMSFDISGTTESIYAYTGSAAAPTFLAAIGISGFTGATTTGLLTGTGLTLGVTAIDIGVIDAGADIAAYNGPRSGQGSFSSYLSLINNTANWATQDAAGSQAGDGTFPDVPFDGGAFTTGAMTPNLSINDVSQAEGDSGTTIFTFTVSLTAPAPAGGVTFDITTAADGTAQGDDFVTRTLTSQTIPEGATTYTFDVTVNGDLTEEANENFFVNVTNVTGATVTDGQGQGIIQNDDTPGSFAINDVTLAEGNSGTTAYTFTITRSGGSDGAADVSYTVSAPGGAGFADSADFAGGTVFSGTVSFADGETSRTITLDVVGDTDFEPTETFTVNLTGTTNGTISDASGTGTISNDDAAPAGTLSVGNYTAPEGNSGTNTFAFTVTRDGGSAGAVSATWTINAPGGAGFADAADFAGGSVFTGTVNFADGETSQVITIDVAGDTDFEPDEAFTVVLSAPTGGAAIGTDTGTGIIQNDDVQPPAGSVSIADAQIIEGDSGTQILVLTLTRTGGTAAFDVNYATSNGGTPGNAAATAGSDYVASSGTASFAAGVDTATIQITINGDTTPELDEEFTVTLSGATNGATISDATAIATITSDDPQPTSVRLLEEDFTGFTAAGFAPNPTATQIDSDIWRVVGLSDIPNPAYGFTATTGDFARGTVGNTDPVTAGVYSPQSNPGLLLQPTGAELEANGFIEARIANTSGSTLTGFDIAFDWTYRNTGNRESNLQLAYSTDGVNFTAVPAGAFTTAAVGAPTNFTLLTQAVSVSLTGLSVAAGDFVYLRWIHASSAGSGNRDEFGIDNVTVDGTGGATGPLVSVSDVSVNEAAGTMTFTVTRTNANSGAFTVDYATADGTASGASDYAATSGTLSFAANQVSQTVTVNINDDATPELDETVLLNLSNATGGATIGDAQGVGTIVNDDGTPIQVSINDVSISEGDSGQQILTFTVTRTGGSGAFSVSYATADDTALAGSDYLAASGTLSFMEAQNSRTVSVVINGDTTAEPNERFSVDLFNATNDAVIIDSRGFGTIVNDEPTLIHDIQGTAYFSPILLNDGINNFNIASTTLVKVQAVITAVDVDGMRTGFYITEENSDWDASLGTSEGIFVMFTNDAGASTLGAGATTPALNTFQVGDLVTVYARVMEYQSFSNMPVTVLTLATNITQDSTGNVVPTLTLDSNHPIPNGILTAVTPNYLDGSDDVGDTFDYSLYALSYFETIESMLVTIPNMRAADGFVTTSGGNPVFQAYSEDHANPGQINSRGGYTISGDPALSPPDTATITDDVRYGGRVVHDGDTNPDIIELDFTDFAMTAPAGIGNVTMGDYIGNVTGIIGFDFTDRKLYVTDIDGYDVSVINGNTPAVEVAEFSAADDPRQLTIATFNVENLDPTDGQAKFDALAQAILINLKLPDILSIEEMQDNNGAAAGDGISPTGSDASVTWGMLVAALNAAALAAGSDAVYQWVDQAPVYNAEGGEQSGNIRVGFLYNTTRVQLGDLPANASLEDRRKYTDRLGDGVRDAGDLIQFDDSMIGGINTTDYTTTRKSLLGQFTFNGQAVFVLANHLPAKSGSGSFWQFNQDLNAGQPANSDWAQRNAIGEDIFNLANYIQQNAPSAGFVAGGDFNDFQFTRALEAATGYVRADGTARNDGAPLTNMTLTLAEAERYTYTFDGRSQAIDHILVNALLAQGASYDVVHLNTGFGAGSAIPLSDHDPAVVRLDMRRFDEVLNGTNGDDYFDVSQGGNDTVSGGSGNDGFYFGSAYTSGDVVDGGAGNRDQIGLQGDYSAGVTLGSITGVEMIVLLPGDDARFGDTSGNFYSYDITSPDSTLAAGQRLTIQANTLRAGENFTFDGSAETDGNFLIYAGLGDDNLTGGAGDDGFFFGQGRFGSGDVVDGGAGDMDQLGLQGDFSGPDAITFGANQLVGVEFIVLLSASDDRFGSLGGSVSYQLTMDDGNVAAGDRMIISATTLTPSESIYFDGSAETDGSFAIYSGGCHDFILGSQNADLIYGGGGDDVIIGNGGADILYGGAGAATFGYFEASDSTAAARDEIRDFKTGDLIDLSVLAFNNGFGDFTFIGNGAQSGAQQLQVIQTGNNATVNIFIDGDAIADLVIDITVADGHTLTEADFTNTSAPPQEPLKASVETGAPDGALVMREFVEPGTLKLGFDEKAGSAPDGGAGYGVLVRSELYDGHPIDFVSLPETLYIGPASGDLLL